ncbi:hypothetical protein NLL45_06505 [Corynebacterium propinquum]|uniref:hypothetical protein n=1 Tax=Corynebacterium propinquum TaxID=43769 RepID=UPI00266FC2E3|nr:hypothetical protein [Corynebacterium propinquum]WKS31198.1 hypothetical protein NLL45_06505 [Corynebacterium propinquum]WKS35645.1 hypothetical protein NLL30_07210 [Corynebacterium propinquum]WKS37630.1 hypothetical protein NLL34_06140 [Corynebacterium propinquum]
MDSMVQHEMLHHVNRQGVFMKKMFTASLAVLALAGLGSSGVAQATPVQKQLVQSSSAQYNPVLNQLSSALSIGSSVLRNDPSGNQPSNLRALVALLKNVDNKHYNALNYGLTTPQQAADCRARFDGKPGEPRLDIYVPQDCSKVEVTQDDYDQALRAIGF